MDSASVVSLRRSQRATCFASAEDQFRLFSFCFRCTFGSFGSIVEIIQAVDLIGSSYRAILPRMVKGTAFFFGWEIAGVFALF